MRDDLDTILNDTELVSFRAKIKKFFEKEGWDAGFKVQMQCWGSGDVGIYPSVITLLDELEYPVCEYCGVRTDRSIKDPHAKPYPAFQFIYVCPVCEGKLLGGKKSDLSV